MTVTSGPNSDSPARPARRRAEHPSMRELVADLQLRRRTALEMGGPERVERVRRSGRLTARERIDLLADPGSFREIGLLAEAELEREGMRGAADGCITGWAKVRGRVVGVIAMDPTVLSATTAYVNARKQMRLTHAVGKAGVPLITLADEDGGRMPDITGWRFGGLPLHFAEFLSTPPGFPMVPRLCAALGPCYGDSSLHAAAAHFTVMTEKASIALSGPSVLEKAIGEATDHQQLGGPSVAAGEPGYACMVVETEEDAIEALKAALGYFPDSAARRPPSLPAAEPAVHPDRLLDVVPTDPNQLYDIRQVIAAIVDRDTYFQWRDGQGGSLLTAFARIGGEVVGIVASQVMDRGGILDVTALNKMHAFYKVCETFNIPLVLLHDVPGVMVGSHQEQRGLLRALLETGEFLAKAEVPKISVIIRKSYGGGYFLMGGNPTLPDRLVAWPGAELGFMAADTAVRHVFQRRLRAAHEAGGVEAEEQLVDELVASWAFSSEPWEAASHFLLDDVIDPRETRDVIIGALESTWGSRSRITAAGV
jgi:acetyl-CoA carboxylase carboxyltransferase component